MFEDNRGASSLAVWFWSPAGRLQRQIEVRRRPSPFSAFSGTSENVLFSACGFHATTVNVLTQADRAANTSRGGSVWRVIDGILFAIYVCAVVSNNNNNKMLSIHIGLIAEVFQVTLISFGVVKCPPASWSQHWFAGQANIDLAFFMLQTLVLHGQTQ